ncbi:hypothetical protein [Methylobacterium sp. CM6247]
MMHLNPLVIFSAVLNQIQPNSSSALLNPTDMNPSNAEIPSLDWKADYYAALHAWKAVKENGTHDHTPMPPPRMITSVQIGLILKATKPAPKRKPKTPSCKHALCVEVWTVPHDSIVRHKRSTQWRKFAQLRTEAGFEKTLAGAVGSQFVTQAFADWAMTIVLDRKPNTRLSDLYGLFHDNNNGWHYYDEHLLRVDMADPNKPVAYIYRNRELLMVEALETDHAGNKFPDGGIQTHTMRGDYANDQ